MPSNGRKTDGERDAAGKFTAGNKCGGRKKKADWVNGKGVEALQVAYQIMIDKEENTSNRLTAAKMIAEYDLGKPRQSVEVDANIPQVIFVGGDKVAD